MELEGLTAGPTALRYFAVERALGNGRIAFIPAIQYSEIGAPVIHGGDFDPWDLTICGGLFGSIRIVAMVEEHRTENSFAGLGLCPKAPDAAVAVALALIIAAGLAVLGRAVVAGPLLAVLAVVV
jgi:hypothetical protein